MAIFSVITVSLSAWSMASTQSFVLLEWPLATFLGLGISCAVLLIIGMYGVKTAVSDKQAGEINWKLLLYAIFLLVSIVLSLISTANILKDVAAIDRGGYEIEERVLRFIEDDKSGWIDAQEQFYCCGWESSDASGHATAKSLCGTNPPNTVREGIQPCENRILTKASEQATAVGTVGTLFSFLQILALLSTVLLFMLKDVTSLYSGFDSVPAMYY